MVTMEEIKLEEANTVMSVVLMKLSLITGSEESLCKPVMRM